MGTIRVTRDGVVTTSSWDSTPLGSPLATGLLPSVVRSSVDAQEALGGHRAVTSLGLYVYPDTIETTYGITIGAINAGQNGIVVRKGRLKESSWNWIPDLPIFVVNAGILTQTPPLTDPIRQVAWAISPTVIHVHFGPTIYQ